MEKIKLYSTNLKADAVSFSEALLNGIAPDRGLYMPEVIPSFPRKELDAFSSMSYHQIAFEVMKKFLAGEIEGEKLLELVTDAYDYAVPLETVTDHKFVLRLDQGPTASFKDFAARMMGRLMNYYLELQNRELLILTATSGDTGSAIANAFFDLDNIKVAVLFPEKEITKRQRKQMTTIGKNIQVIAVDGKFDDCQAMVKEAFADPELKHLNLSSANSINIGRLIPQSVYYFYSFSKLRKGSADDDMIFSVPSGNFGDMMGGVLAMHMGLPVKKFIIATNENDVFPTFLQSGNYHKIEPSRNCISSAMNVGHPSNMSRLIALYGGQMDEKGNIHKMPDIQKMKEDIFAVSINDEQTRECIHKSWNEHQLLLEPHGAVGWAGLERYLNQNPEDQDCISVCLETAHPAKFPEEINKILGFDPELPPSLQGLEDKEENYDLLGKTYEEFKKYLLK